MTFKTIFAGVAALLLLSMAWKHKNSDWMQSLTAPARSASQTAIRFDNDAPRSDMPTAGGDKSTSRKGAVGIRKCRHGEQVTYTDGDCPAGSHEHAVDGGAVTVVPGQRTQPTANLPHARELLLPEDGQSRLRDQAMERVINR